MKPEFEVYDKTEFTESYSLKDNKSKVTFCINYQLEKVTFLDYALGTDRKIIDDVMEFAEELNKNYQNEV